MVADRFAIEELLESAVSLLPGDEWLDWSELESDNTVLRANLASGRSVIVKHVTDTGFDQPGHHGAPQRFLNEWAGLGFLSDLGVEDVAPAVIAADASSGVLVLEDLGVAASLESALLGEEPWSAAEGLIEMGKALARLHGRSRGHEQRFREAQSGLGTGSPMSDSTMDQRARRDLFGACFETAGLELSETVWQSIVAAEGLMHEESVYRALVHADAGPHNVLLADVGTRLIDFEFCVFRNAFADVVGARLGFPQTATAMAVPGAHVEQLEVSYRETVVEWLPEVADDGAFTRSLGAAAAHWALNRIAAAWRLHVEPRIDDVTSLPSHEADRLAGAMLVVEGFVEVARDRRVFEDVAEAVDACARRWRELWPVIGYIPLYPALRNGS